MVLRFVALPPVRIVTRVESVDTVVPGCVPRKVQRPLEVAQVRLLPSVGVSNIAVVDDAERNAVVLLLVDVLLVAVPGGAGADEIVRGLGTTAAGRHREDLRLARTGARQPLDGLFPVGMRRAGGGPRRGSWRRVR